MSGAFPVHLGTDRWYFRAWSFTGWWLGLGPIHVGLRDHRTHRALFSERHNVNPRRRYFHVGPYCLVIERTEAA